jgi:hypothetical protein
MAVEHYESVHQVLLADRGAHFDPKDNLQAGPKLSVPTPSVTERGVSNAFKASNWNRSPSVAGASPTDRLAKSFVSANATSLAG